MQFQHPKLAEALAHVPRDSPRIRLVPFAGIKLGTERRYLVKGLIPRVGLTVVWGPPKCGKSFWTFDLAMAVALGWSYRGLRVHQGPVVYCCFEGQTGMQARVEAYRQRFLAEEPDTIPFFLEPVTLDLVRDHQGLIAAIKASLGTVMPVMVVLDTLNRSLRGSESSDECGQPQDGQGTRLGNSADATRPRRRGDRVAVQLAASAHSRSWHEAAVWKCPLLRRLWGLSGHRYQRRRFKSTRPKCKARPAAVRDFRRCDDRTGGAGRKSCQPGAATAAPHAEVFFLPADDFD
jgi:hypothetical protein